MELLGEEGLLGRNGDEIDNDGYGRHAYLC